MKLPNCPIKTLHISGKSRTSRYMLNDNRRTSLWSAWVSAKSHAYNTYPLIEENDSILCLNSSLLRSLKLVINSIQLYHLIADDSSPFSTNF